MIYHCCDERRRRRVREHPVLNGIDYIEVLDADAVPLGSPRQRTLLVRFVKAAPALTVESFEITGGERIADVRIEWATRANAPNPLVTTPLEQSFLVALPDPEEVIALRTSSSGDYSTYTLHLVAAAGAIVPPANIDPLLARVDFSFKVECPSDYDCAPNDLCPEPAEETPQISYLAKDYTSFRRLMLDRMAQTLPQWSERNAADLGIALVEVLAYVGDRLSYAQDAVATEAYLGTARRRTSVRRHARLVDYAMHDGANARAWVQVRVGGADPVPLARAETKFLTKVAGAEPIVPPPAADPLFERLLLQRPLVFEPCEDKQLFALHNEMFFHEWGEGECCLPKGATRATLNGDFPDLAVGDVLVFEEILGPHTGRTADADLHKRCAVRLVQVAAGLEDPLTNPPTPITEIRWAEEDALPFALCLSARTGREFGERIVGPVSRALGNIVLADHGLTRTGVAIGTVPEPHLFLAANSGRCMPAEREAVPPRFAPMLAEGPLTQADDPPAPEIPASAVLVQALSAVRPQIALDSTLPGGGGERWIARRELLNSDAAAAHFVVEVEADGRARLRYGDDRHGKRPASGTAFEAGYRVGNGPVGNIGADSLAHVVTGLGEIVGVRNPMPARGGREPESVAQARVAAPQAFRVQERAVTPEDYAAIALRHPGVQRAAATFRWNGHGHTVFVTVDRFGARPITEEFEVELLAFLEPFRMAGYDLEIDAPHYVSLEIELLVCAKPGYFRSEVKGAVLQVLDDGVLPDGELGVFHPDRLTFDQDVYLSAIVAQVQAIDGVESVTPVVFRRQGQPDPAPLESGVLPIGRLEIPRLANDPNFPERGKLTVTMGGGK
ncbi:putative baseplate assembly protein [Microvirga sp. BSC39]|uniref:putative baseplate assembly protein n=1 Tax=Microvirga sp. BSC39 TaxID=1549810 RepID=UPI0004E969BF|nr:putative baseplate assembly protein [Microvirga sp. BSC39]KFG69588.1 hypothetical protein JH26_09700 [Microvirga sp. BSC39]